MNWLALKLDSNSIVEKHNSGTFFNCQSLTSVLYHINSNPLHRHTTITLPLTNLKQHMHRNKLKITTLQGNKPIHHFLHFPSPSKCPHPNLCRMSLSPSVVQNAHSCYSSLLSFHLSLLVLSLILLLISVSLDHCSCTRMHWKSMKAVETWHSKSRGTA